MIKESMRIIQLLMIMIMFFYLFLILGIYKFQWSYDTGVKMFITEKDLINEHDFYKIEVTSSKLSLTLDDIMGHLRPYFGNNNLPSIEYLNRLIHTSIHTWQKFISSRNLELLEDIMSWAIFESAAGLYFMCDFCKTFQDEKDKVSFSQYEEENIDSFILIKQANYSSCVKCFSAIQNLGVY